MSSIATLVKLHGEQRFSEMESMATLLLRDAPENALLWNLLGVALHAQARDALEAFRQAVKHAPGDADFRFNFAVALFSRKAYAEAFEAYRAALEIRPANVQYLHGCGCSLFRLGRYAEASPYYEKLAGAEQGNADIWSEYGQTLFALGHHALAAGCFSKLVTLRNSHPDGHILLGNACRKLGKTGEAVDCYRKALHLRPEHAATCYSLGDALTKLGHPEEAMQALHLALAIDPANGRAANDLGTLYLGLGRIQDALAQYELANRLLPGNMDVLYNIGNALLRLERADKALALFERVIASVPDHYMAWNGMGSAYTNMSQYAKATPCLDACLRIRPDYAPAYSNYAIVLIKLWRFEEALKACSRAMEIAGKDAGNLSNRSEAYVKLGRFAEALEDAGLAVKMAPNDPVPHMKLADAFYFIGRKAEAMTTVELALSVAPDDAETQFNASLHLLRQGAYQQGFALYEARRQVRPYKYLLEQIEGLRWSGDVPLKGKSLLLYAEQGLGDAIQMLRFVPLVAQMATAVVLRVKKNMAPLLESIPQNVTVIVEEEVGLPSLKVDYICSLMSLPHALKISPDSLPEPKACISTPARKHRHWRARLAGNGKKRIGIAWSGNPNFPGDNWRSLPFMQFARLFDGLHEIEIVAIQKDVREADQAALKTAQVRHFGEQMADLADAAAIIEEMDLVISVDTVVAHLAGALGKEVWLLIPFVGDWRWLSDTDRSPWYPSMRIFRQTALNQWQDVLENVAALLRNQPDWPCNSAPDGSHAT